MSIYSFVIKQQLLMLFTLAPHKCINDKTVHSLPKNSVNSGFSDAARLRGSGASVSEESRIKHPEHLDVLVDVPFFSAHFS